MLLLSFGLRPRGRRQLWRNIPSGCRNKLDDVGTDRYSREGKQNEIRAVLFHDQVRQRLGPARLHFGLRIKPVHRFGKFCGNNRQDAEQREPFALSDYVGLGHNEIRLLKPDVGVAVDLQGRCVR